MIEYTSIRSTSFPRPRRLHVLRPRATDGIVQELEHAAVTDFQVPEFPLDLGLVKEDVAAGRSDDATPLSSNEQLDPALGGRAGVNRLRRPDALGTGHQWCVRRQRTCGSKEWNGSGSQCTPSPSL